MHPTALASARGKAIEDMRSAATRLADYFKLDGELVKALEPTAKDPQVRELQRLQGIAALLSAIPTPLVITTLEETVAEPVKFDELPAPEIIEEAPAARKRVKSKAE